jgi:hypothetical protein
MDTREWFYAPSVLAANAYIQIKFIYSSIQKYKIRTRMHWDNTNGANINGEAAERVWNNYIAQKVCWLTLRCPCGFYFAKK